MEQIRQFGLIDTILVEFPNNIIKNFEKMVELVTNMITYCLENNFRPILVTPPSSEILNKRLFNKFLQSFLYNNINKANIQNVPFLGYMEDKRFKDYKLYINSDFLNKTRRDKFTDVLIKDLELLRYIN